MNRQPTIVWLRDDLGITDNPALLAGSETGAPVIVLYLLDELSPEVRALGSASRWWLHHSLVSLERAVVGIGGTLVLRRGAAEVELPRLVEETDAATVLWNRRYSAAREIDARLKTRLRASGVAVQSFQANLLFEPWTIRTGDDRPYRVFTPFWRACLASGPPRSALPAPAALEPLDAAAAALTSDSLDDWALLPSAPDWSAGLAAMWRPGEAGARARLEHFAAAVLVNYHRRDEPAPETTSHLSPHLRFGEISPFQVWEEIHRHITPELSQNAARFLSEIGWREFNWNILFHSPKLATKNFRPEFDAFPWQEPDPAELRAWQHGRTGIPIVDAGMRELWHTGYMHNRVRMVVASFLVKNLRVDWRVGEEWFWDTLVDADEASNPGNWQWVAGSGADAAPYFRVFNPVLQAEKFDPRREYIDRWVPAEELLSPIVDLKTSRDAALAAYKTLKTASKP